MFVGVFDDKSPHVLLPEERFKKSTDADAAQLHRRMGEYTEEKDVQARNQEPELRPRQPREGLEMRI